MRVQSRRACRIDRSVGPSIALCARRVAHNRDDTTIAAHHEIEIHPVLPIRLSWRPFGAFIAQMSRSRVRQEVGLSRATPAPAQTANAASTIALALMFSHPYWPRSRSLQQRARLRDVLGDLTRERLGVFECSFLPQEGEEFDLDQTSVEIAVEVKQMRFQHRLG